MDGRCLAAKHCCRASVLQVSGAVVLVQQWGQKAQWEQLPGVEEGFPPTGTVVTSQEGSTEEGCVKVRGHVS